jgi:hypothetical protein
MIYTSKARPFESFFEEQPKDLRSTVNIFELKRERRDLVNQIWPKVFRLFLEKRLKGPGFTGVYHVSKIQEAIAAIQTKQHVVASWIFET